MSIHVEIGEPGAGKSYNAVKQALTALRGGRVVVTNLPIKKEHPDVVKWVEDGLLHLYANNPDETDPDTENFGKFEGWKRFSEKDNPYIRDVSQTDNKGGTEKLGALIIVDEAQNAFTNMIRTKRKAPYEFDDLTKFFRLHRHALVDIILLYHSHTSVDGDIKPLVSDWHHITNTTEFYGFNSYTIGTSKKGFVAGRKSYTEPPKMHKFKADIFEYYDSYSQGVGAGTKGKKGSVGLRKGTALWRRGGFIFLVLALLLIPIIGYFAFGRARAAITQENTLKNLPEAPSQNRLAASLPLIGNNQPQAVQSEQPSQAVAYRPDGLPQESTVLVGFDSQNIFLRGVILNRDADLTPERWSVIKAESCEVILTRQEYSYERLGPVVVSYKCERGF